MVRLIVARGSNNSIGKDNQLLWHLPDDMKFFKESTSGHVVVLGRKSWDSIPEKFRPLSGRTNVVLTRNPEFFATGCMVFHDLSSALAAYANEDIFIIGGEEIYRQALDSDCVDEMLITEVSGLFHADRFFPKFNPDRWNKTLIAEHDTDDRHRFSFRVFLWRRK